MMDVHRGEVYLIELNGQDSEQSGVRPVVIIQNEVGNKYSPCTIVACITSRSKRHISTHVGVDLLKPSTVLCEQIFTVTKERLIKKLGELPESVMQQINEKLLVSLGI